MAYIEKRKTQDGDIKYRVLVRLKGHPIQTATFERLTVLSILSISLLISIFFPVYVLILTHKSKI
jgi:hypothetical protein